jgi:hypothetical protein
MHELKSFITIPRHSEGGNTSLSACMSIAGLLPVAGSVFCARDSTLGVAMSGWLIRPLLDQEQIQINLVKSDLEIAIMGHLDALALEKHEQGQLRARGYGRNDLSLI